MKIAQFRWRLGNFNDFIGGVWFAVACLMADRRFDPEEATKRDRPPIHFSLQDPWRDCRLSLHYTGSAVVRPSFPIPAASTDSLTVTAATTIFDDVDDTAAKPLVSSIKRVNGVSTFRGVVWDKSSRTWRSKIKVKAKTWYLGIFEDDVSAAKAYDAASYFVHGL